jgi:hypothetical protein
MLILLLFSQLAWAAATETLDYNGGPHQGYHLTMDSSEVTFRDHRSSLKIERRACNQRLVDLFWQETQTHFKRLPSALNRKVASADPVIRLGQEVRQGSGLLWSQNSADYFRYLPNRVWLLVMKEQQLCGK